MRANVQQAFGLKSVRGRRIATAIAALVLGGALAGMVFSAAGSGRLSGQGEGLWSAVSAKLPATHDGAKADVRPAKLDAFKLDKAGLQALLQSAPAATNGPESMQTGGVVVSLPDPKGGFQRFLLGKSNIMAPGLAAKHPEISTFSGKGIDDPKATIHADVSPLGFNASIRTPTGAWYIQPYYHLDQSVYASFYGHDMPGRGTVGFVERDASGAELSVDKGYYHAADSVTLSGSGYPGETWITITVSDPEEHFADRTMSAKTDNLGAFDKSFVADPNGNLETHIVEASDGGDNTASTSYQVVRDDDPTSDPPTGDPLRTYRTALITDPGYAAYFGGPPNVTPAKVALINRVSQVYEDDLSIKLQLVANNDLLNFDTWAQAIGPNGPCGAAACFTQSQVTGCSSTTRARFVIGQIIGATNYDLGHLALGQPGGGVANLGVVGRSNKAGGCTGIPTPTGDFYAIDYVAHEMGHQFSGNHPFNGTQLNCSGGNRSGATSVETGSGSSIMAYAGICSTDDLQAHSDPYFYERSLQEISTYTSSNQAAINEVQTASLRHFGGGNEVQVVTFGPGFAPTATIQPLTVNIGAVPSATQLGGAQEFGNTVTISTGAAGSVHTLQVGDVVVISGVANAGYNGTFTVTSVPTTRSFTYTNPTSGLPISGGGIITLTKPGLSEVGTTVTVNTAAAHGRSLNDIVTITGAGNAAYNGTFQITGVPSPRSFQYTAGAAGLAASGGGTMTYFSPFRMRYGANDSTTIGTTVATAYTNANIQSALNAITGAPGGAVVSGAASTGFTVTYSAAPSAGVDVASFSLQGLTCSPTCFSSVEETNHGGANDSFKINYNGVDSALITNGTNYTTAGIQAAIQGIAGWPAGATATVAGFGGGALNNTGFQVTFAGTLATTNVSSLTLTNFSAGASGFVGETDIGGAVTNKGGIITVTGNAIPVVTAPVQYTIPLRTPFTLTGSATDADLDPLLYSWEQNDRGGGTGTTLLSNTKTNGPLFAMFPVSGQISLSDALLYNSPGQNHLTGDPSRTFPDLQQIIDNNTNADTGSCPQIPPIAPPVPQAVTECFAEFLPTTDYVGFAGTNATPLSLHMRLTARDGKGGVNSGDTTLLLANTTGPFRVTSAPGSWVAGSTQTVTWDVAGTNGAPVNTTDVKISLSTDGGHTYPWVLAASTPNDGSQAIVVPNAPTKNARIKVEAVGNIFFDISNADFVVTIPGIIGLDSLGASGNNSIDSYNSANGPYGGANKGNNASVFSNNSVTLGPTQVGGTVRSATSNVVLGGGGQITGDVRAGTTITAPVGSILGTKTPNSPSQTINPSAVAACSPYTAAVSGATSYSSATGDLVIGSGKTVTLAAGTYCFRNVTLTGTGRLNVGGAVVVVVNGMLTSSGGGSFNTVGGVPGNLQVKSSYTGANGVSLNGGSAYMTVFAPTTNVILGGGVQLFGAVLGKTLTFSGVGGAIHFDLQLVTVWSEYFQPPPV